MEPEILYEDNHLLAVNKPPGLLTQGDYRGDPSLLEILKSYLKRRDRKPGKVFLGLIQRLDRPVSGVVLLAKTSKGASRLSAQIRERQVVKLYIAVCEVSRAPNQTVIGPHWQEFRHFLERSRDRTRIEGAPGPNRRLGVLAVRRLIGSGEREVLAVRLITGRKHQIRAQLAHLGRPIVGDRRYGSSSGTPHQEVIGLHACCLRSDHPTRNEPVIITAPLPDHLLGGLPMATVESLHRELDREIERIGRNQKAFSD